MERVLCEQHGRPCILKTGVSGGHSHGVSFYMCSNFKSRCNFVQTANNVPPITCPLHGGMVSVRSWDNKTPQKINFFCLKKTSKTCGSIMVNVSPNGKENEDPEMAMTVEKSSTVLKYDSYKTPAFPHASASSLHASDLDSELDSGIKSTDDNQQDKYMYSSEHDTSLDNTSSDKSSTHLSPSPPVRRALVINTDEESTPSSGGSPDKIINLNSEEGTGEDPLSPYIGRSPEPSSSPYIIPEPPSTTGLSMFSMASLGDGSMCVHKDNTYPNSSISLSQDGFDEDEVAGEEYEQPESIDSTLDSEEEDSHHFGNDSVSILDKSALEFIASSSKTSAEYNSEDDDTGSESSMEENTEGEAEEVSLYEEENPTSSPPSSSTLQHVLQTHSYRDSTYQYDSDSSADNSTAQNSDSECSVSSHSNTFSTRQEQSPLPMSSPLKIDGHYTNSDPSPVGVHESEPSPVDVHVVSESETSPVDVHVVSESKPSPVVVVSESKPSPVDVHVSESEPSPVGVHVVSESEPSPLVVSESEPSPVVVVSESKPSPVDVHVSESEPSPVGVHVVSESEPSPLVVSESEPSPVVVVSESKPSPVDVHVSESKPSPVGVHVVSESEPSPVDVVSESEPSPVVVVSESKPSPVDVHVSESEPSPVGVHVVSESEPSPLVVSESEPSPVVVVSESKPSPVDVHVSESKPSPVGVHVVSESEPSPVDVVSESEPAPVVVVSESKPSPVVVVSESKPSPVGVQQSVSFKSSQEADDHLSFKTSPIFAVKRPEVKNEPILMDSFAVSKVSPPNPPLMVAKKEPVKEKEEPQFKLGYQARTLAKQYEMVELLIRTMSDKLPDGGAQLRATRETIIKRLEHLKRSVPQIDPAANSQPAMTTAKNRLTYNARMLTTGAVEQLHSSLENCPTVDTVADDPPGLKVELMRHQKRALAWMQWREQQIPSSGILADDMGLGKTLSMLSLVLSKKDESPKEVKEWMKKPSDGLVKSPGTLVVCPASLMMQWEGEVRNKLRPGTLRTNVYHGSSRIGFPHELAAYDLVITTYNIAGIEAASCGDDEPQPAAAPGKGGAKKKKRTSSFSTLFKVHWRRVILDEAHVIRNHKSGQSIGACKLKSDYRWAVTGTPIQNHLKDFYSLIKFIGLAPFDDFRVWKATVERKGTLGMQRLNTMVSSLVLRRTKEEMSKELAQLKLTKKMVETHRIKLAEKENRVYQVLFREARKVMYHWLQEQGEDAHLRKTTETGPGGEEETDKPDLPPEVAGLIMNVLRPCLLSSAKGRCVLALLLRLRQCCSHLQLLTRVPKPAERDQDELELNVAMSALQLESDSDSQFSSDDVEVIPPEFTKEERSTKIEEVVEQLKKIRENDCDGPPQKSIIVSQWTSMLDIMQYHLDIAGLSHVRIDGTVPPAKRNQYVDTFNSPHTNPTVMLLSLQAGGVGLNLIGANHVFMLDMHWNPALEVQAADRCHRVGQKRDVFIHKFVCEGTVEERILSLQEKKLSMAKNVLEGASERSRSTNKLSLTDLKHLFEID